MCVVRLNASERARSVAEKNEFDRKNLLVFKCQTRNGCAVNARVLLFSFFFISIETKVNKNCELYLL